MKVESIVSFRLTNPITNTRAHSTTLFILGMHDSMVPEPEKKDLLILNGTKGSSREMMGDPKIRYERLYFLSTISTALEGLVQPAVVVKKRGNWYICAACSLSLLELARFFLLPASIASTYMAIFPSAV